MDDVRQVETPDGRTLTVREAGDRDGVAVLVHHGTPGSSLHCAADVAAVCDALGIERLCVWGASGGGPHTLATSALLPDRVAAAAALASLAPLGADGLDFQAELGGRVRERAVRRAVEAHERDLVELRPPRDSSRVVASAIRAARSSGKLDHRERGYTRGMKTAVSIPDELFRRAEELAERLGKSRSQVYREALSEYLARREPRAVTSALDELVAELGAGSDAWVEQAARRTLERAEW
jgi:pimeloyl-ACP methyl ester carboxylesterase